MTAERRFELDRSGERAVSLLRLVAAGSTGAGAVWLAASGPGVVGWVVALAGGLAAVGFTAAYRKGRRRAASPERHFLLLDERGLTLAEGHDEHQIEWRDVTAVEVDEERLIVVVSRASEAPLRIEPRYEGVSVYDLETAIRERWLMRSGVEVVK
jgi:hypothetical protein